MTSGISENGEFLAPWRQVSAISDTEVVYYTSSQNSGCASCLPSSPSTKLSRYVLQQSNVRNIYTDTPDNSVLAGKRVLIIVNPKSGSGSESIVRSNVASVTSILSEVGLESVVLYTKHPRHAVDLVADHGPEELARFAAVVSLGGDGTLQETLNGLCKAFRRPEASTIDWSMIPPLAVVPGGTGNAMAASLNLRSPEDAALNIVHSLRANAAKPMAVIKYARTGRDDDEIISVGGMQWGFSADVDQGTEYLRFLGDARFDIGAVIQIVKKKTAGAKIKVTVDTALHEHTASAIEMERKQHKGAPSEPVDYGEKISDDTFVLEGQFAMCVAWNSQFIGEGVQVLPKASVTQVGVFDFIVVHAGISRGEMVKMFTSVEDGSFIWKTASFTYYKATRVEFERLDGEFLTLDGERVPVEPFILDMAPQDGKLRILDSFSASM